LYPFLFDDRQSSTAAIYPQKHCVGWALPNTRQTFQDMVWYLFLMGDAHPTGLLNMMTAKAQQSLSILKSRQGRGEAAHARESLKRGSAISRSPGFPPSRE